MGIAGEPEHLKKLLFLVLVFFLLLAGCQLRSPLYDLATTGPSDIPRIITFDPADNLYDIPRNAFIGMLFSKPMEQQSLEDNFRYSYNGNGYDASDGSFVWDSSNRVAVFRPYSFFPSITEVTVNVDLHVQSKDGFYLDKSYEWRFETSSFSDFGPFYSITSFWASEETALPGIHTLDAKIVLEFDKEMLRSSVEGSFQLLSDDFQDIRTVSDGYFQWSEPAVGVKRAIFTPYEPLMPGKNYRIYLNANGIIALDIAGNNYNGIMPAPLLQFQTIDAIYVSTTGDDANEGYVSVSPVRTISRAIQLALEHGLPFIKIEEGVYNEDIVLNGSAYDGFTIQGGWNSGFTVYDPWFTPSEIQALSNNYAITLSNVNYCALEGLTVQGLSTGPPDVNGAVLINSGSRNIRIDSCDILGSDNAATAYGIHITGNSDNIEINNSICEGALLNTIAKSYAISVQNARNIHIWNNPSLGGRSGTTANAGIYIRNASDVIIENNSISGGWDGKIDGILLEDGAQNITILGNWITADVTGNYPSSGIFITGNTFAIIRDNAEINGGNVTDNNTYGIWVENGAVADIYRNTIIGGLDSGGLPGQKNIGVGFNNAGDCNLFNNFIVGGRVGTNPNSTCIGVSVENSDVDIINNTINGQGSPGASLATLAIFGHITRSNIINNIILGGVGLARYGITLSSYNTTENDVLIYNNAFDNDYCRDGYLFDASLVYPPEMIPSNYNSVPRKPSDNSEYFTGQVAFFNPDIGDFIINTGGSSNLLSIQNNGYSQLDDILTSAEMDEVTVDRIRNPRPSSSMDRGGHEFNP
jgi:hypothetical protein